jgi:hypothetical protein
MLRDGDEYRIELRTPLAGDEPYKTATFDPTFTRGTILMREDVKPAHPFEYPLDEVHLSNLLGRGRGVELHSCGLIEAVGGGRVFVGGSGAGTPTPARLWESVARGIVSDDRVIVREQDGAMRMYGTPWHGEAELALPESVELAGVYLLAQADENAILALPRAEAVARLFRCTFPLFHEREALGFTLSFLERIAELVPVVELRFKRERSVVNLVLRESR